MFCLNIKGVVALDKGSVAKYLHKTTHLLLHPSGKYIQLTKYVQHIVICGNVQFISGSNEHLLGIDFKNRTTESYLLIAIKNEAVAYCIFNFYTSIFIVK